MTVFLERETLEMSPEVQMNITLQRDKEMALARLGGIS